MTGSGLAARSPWTPPSPSPGGPGHRERLPMYAGAVPRSMCPRVCRIRLPARRTLVRWGWSSGTPSWPHWPRQCAARPSRARQAWSSSSGEAGGGQELAPAGVCDGRLTASAPVLWGACDPLSTPRPLGPLHDARAPARRRGHGRCSAAPASRTRSSPPSSSTSGCTRRVLVVDDLHWADQATIDLLRFLLRRIRITGSLMVGTLRDDEIGADASAALPARRRRPLARRRDARRCRR